MYYLRSECGVRGFYETSNYDHACRVAHYVRELAEIEVFVVNAETHHAMSEVVESNSLLDAAACAIAESLV